MGRLSPETDPLELVFARLDEGSSSAGAGNVLPLAASPSVNGTGGNEVAPDLPASAKIDLSLESAVSALVDRLVKPLQSFYPQSRIDGVRSHLVATLSKQYAPTWREDDPLHGTGYRSLICLPGVGLPQAMVVSARQNGVDPAVWMRSLAARLRGENSPLQEEWQAWCDPGLVMWRYGGWFWNDSEFDPVKSYREPLQTIWAAPNLLTAEGGGPSSSTAPSVSTPLRASRAIPIRAPQLFAVPPTPSSEIGTPGRIPALLLPSASIAHPSPLRPGLSHEASSTGSPVQKRSHADHSRTPSASHDGQAARAGPGHRGSDSQSSVDSIAAGIQLLTPGTRPGSANPFQDPASGSDTGSAKAQETPVVPVRGRDPSPNTPRYPSESASGTPTNAPQTTPYDNGNVIVIGGGVKLGGSRPASAAPHSRRPGDRDRSPSISIASRALSSVMSNGSRKTRSRRRIMPSYLGHLDQPGVGGPVHGPFAAAPPVAPGAQPAPMPWNLLPGQPAQMLPVAQMLMADPKMQAGVQSAIRAATQLLRQPGQPLQKFGQKGGSLVVNTPAGPMWIPADPFLNSAWSGAAAPASGSAPAPASAPAQPSAQAQGQAPAPAQRM